MTFKAFRSLNQFSEYKRAEFTDFDSCFSPLGTGFMCIVCKGMSVYNERCLCVMASGHSTVQSGLVGGRLGTK